jgi:hypothetical protein
MRGLLLSVIENLPGEPGLPLPVRAGRLKLPIELP